MNQDLINAISILLIGMFTVFIILYLIVIVGNGIIKFTNKFISVKEVIKPLKDESVSNDVKAVIIATVDTITNRKGKVTKITKI